MFLGRQGNSKREVGNQDGLRKMRTGVIVILVDIGKLGRNRTGMESQIYLGSQTICLLP